MKRSKKITLLLVASALSGCGLDYDPAEAPKEVKRDSYSKIEDCIADWGDKNLCLEAAKMAQHEKDQLAARNPSGGGGGVVFVNTYPFYGPEYVPGSRYTYYNGAQVAPRSNFAAGSSPSFKPSSSFISSRSQAVKTASAGSGPSRGSPGSSARGGFGGTGSSFSGGGG